MKYVLWDFDGVIINSDEIRMKGFVHALRKYKEDDIDKLISYHKANGGLSRYNKFEYFFSKILEVTVEQSHINKLCSDYTEIMLKNLGNKDLLIKDSIDFIEQKRNEKDMILVSASDGIELNKLCKKLKIDHYFSMILGSPKPKDENLRDLVKTKRIDPAMSIYIGDSINDKQAAEENSIKFFGYNNRELLKSSKNYIYTFQEFNLS